MYDNENSSVLQEIFHEMETPKTPPPKVRSWTCSASDLAGVRGLTKPSATDTEIRAVVEDAVKKVVGWAWKAAGSLRTSPRSASTIKIFKDIFVKAPDWQPPWKPAKASWIDFGDLIAVRILSAAKILDGGWIKYFCYGATKYCPECSKNPPAYHACSSWGKSYRICLGEGFWKKWKSGKPIDLDRMALTLLHEALHIYFGKTVGHSGWSGNANCYKRFIAEINGVPVPPDVKSRCS